MCCPRLAGAPSITSSGSELLQKGGTWYSACLVPPDFTGLRHLLFEKKEGQDVRDSAESRTSATLKSLSWSRWNRRNEFRWLFVLISLSPPPFPACFTCCEDFASIQGPFNAHISVGWILLLEPFSKAQASDPSAARSTSDPRAFSISTDFQLGQQGLLQLCGLDGFP